MFPLILMLLTAPDSAKLTLVPNTKEILQRDNLLLLTVLENHSISAVRLFGDMDSFGGWIRHEIQDKNGKWVKVKHSVDQIGVFCGARGKCMLDAKSTYAECEAMHRRSLKGAFLFETPGTYKIRAVATMPWGELPSEPVTITVRKREETDLQKIESVPPGDLWVLALPNLETPLPEKLVELKAVGGNIAWTIDQWQMAQAACEGGEWKGTRVTKEKNCEWLRENMAPVAYEHSLEHLGSYYRATKHWEGLSRVVPAMKYDSVKRRGFIRQLELLTKPPMPAMP
ncbi:MAG: hypothetical protein ACR2FY_25465 [Pirellulaceae bacterium]